MTQINMCQKHRSTLWNFMLWTWSPDVNWGGQTEKFKHRELFWIHCLIASTDGTWAFMKWFGFVHKILFLSWVYVMGLINIFLFPKWLWMKTKFIGQCQERKISGGKENCEGQTEEWLKKKHLGVKLYAASMTLIYPYYLNLRCAYRLTRIINSQSVSSVTFSWERMAEKEQRLLDSDDQRWLLVYGIKCTVVCTYTFPLSSSSHHGVKSYSVILLSSLSFLVLVLSALMTPPLANTLVSREK